MGVAADSTCACDEGPMQKASPANAPVKLAVGIPTVAAEPEITAAAEHLEAPAQLAGGGTWKDAG